jgi:enamine deaminase RidA (YjgF/YER057c/UK114 family)
MEEAQARGSGGGRLSGCGLAERAQAALSLDYVSYAELAARVGRAKHLLGVVAFGSGPPASTLCEGSPFIRVEMPSLDGDGCCEIWGSGQPVQAVNSHGISGAHNRDLLFGCLQVPVRKALEEASRAAYGRVFDFIDALGFPYLMRAWNYFPGINDEAEGVERYRRFNIGRHEAFAAKGRTIGVDMPAACALGCDGGPLTVYFLAARTAGLAVENPRQVSAFDYPEQYGPRSPTFSRAMLMQPAGRRVLAISGTASVVGHETRHKGEPAAQIAETIANIRALIEAAGEAGARPIRSGDLMLKAYLRDPVYLPAMQRALTQAFGDVRVAYLRADICRSDLLVEVEGMLFLA